MVLLKTSSGVATLLCVVTLSLSGQRLADPIHHELLSQGIDLTLRQEYHAADSVFIIISQRFPAHPSGYLYRAAVVESRSMDFVSEFHQERFDSLLGIARTLSEQIIAREPESPWGYYFLGTTLGYDAFTRANRGDWLGGLLKGLSSAGQFKTCVEKDSLFYDAYAGLGTYFYWKSRKIELLTWLPFITDNRDEGIQLLQRCWKLGTYNRYLALSSLLSIFLDAGELGHAEETAREALSRYPMNRVFLWGMGRVLLARQRYGEALEVYSSLLKSIERETISNPISVITCRLNIVRAKLALRDTVEVSSHLKSVLGYESFRFPEEVQARAKAKFEEAKNFQVLLKNQRVFGN